MFGRALKAKNAHHLGPAFFDLLLPNGKMSNAKLGNFWQLFQISVSNCLIMSPYLVLKSRHPLAYNRSWKQYNYVLQDKLYDLRYEEVKVVEPGFEMTEVAYKKQELV